MHQLRFTPALTALFVLAACTGNSPKVTYTFTAYDDASSTWTVLEIDKLNGVRTEYKLVCDYWRSGTKFHERGPKACNVRLGILYIPTVPSPIKSGSLPGNALAASFMAVYKSAGHLTFSYRLRGDKELTENAFSIKAAKVVGRE